MTLGSKDGPASLVDRILSTERVGDRRLICLAGPPASGKSTLAETLEGLLTDRGCISKVVPMDGFHLHNQILMERDLLARKGAPETFDVLGLLNLVTRLRDKAEVIYPTFDRDRDIAIAGSGVVDEDCDTIIVEGNYLLMEAPHWRQLHTYWDLSIFIDVPESVLTERLIDRWLVHGLTPQEAEKRARQNDLVNAKLVCETVIESDVVYRTSD